MKIELIIAQVMAEIDRAETLHPVWPNDFVKAAAIPAEEAGELLKAANDHNEKNGSSSVCEKARLAKVFAVFRKKSFRKTFQGKKKLAAS